MRELKVVFGNHRIKNKEKLPLKEVQSKPNVIFNKPANKYYTYILVDPDAPYRNEPTYKHVLHWLVVNVSNDEKTQTIVDKFRPSSPPAPRNQGESNEHRYFFYLFEQPSLIEVPEQKRMKFNLDQFIRKYKLKPIRSVMYRTESETPTGTKY
jgi:phosphatidylethanolamine-binding protein (PEBP) family uncharacterized protein